MKIPAIAAGSLFAALMVFTALSPRAEHEAVWAVRNTARGWEAPLPPLVRAGINVALLKMGIPMFARHCAAPSALPEATDGPVAVRTSRASAENRGCPKPAARAAFKSGVGSLVPAAGELRQGI
ncbi:MAG TPA: hypothetical protein VGI93_17700 [Steroidobacteraceae bacterium]